MHATLFIALYTYIINDCDLIFRFRDVVNKQKDGLLAMGYPSFTLEDFHDSVR